MKYIALLSIISSVLFVVPASSANHKLSTFQVERRQPFVKPSLYHQANLFRGGEEVVPEGGEEVVPEAVTGEDAIIPTPAEAEPSALSKKMANLKERAVPALLMLGGVGALIQLFKEQGLVFLTLVVQVGMYQEMTNVIGGKLQSFMKWWWFLTASLAFNGPRLMPLYTSEIAAASYAMISFGIVSTIIRFQLADADAANFREFMRQTAISALSTLLVVLPSSFWISTLKEYGLMWVIYSAILVIVNDTMAYFFGIAFGEHPLLPTISPKKTWEGFIGAALSTIAIAIYWLPSTQDALMLSTVVSLIGPFGGFLASVIKRAYEQKDFGSIFPGHGGFVDRLDCQLMLAPFVYLYLVSTTSN